MPEKTAVKSKGSTPVYVWVIGAVGLGLVAFGLSKMGGAKGEPINAKFNFDHQGLAGNYQLRVRFGTAGALGVFAANSDLVKLEGFTAEAHPDWTPLEMNVQILIPPKATFGFPLPFTYDAEAMIIDEYGNVPPDCKVITESVFTHTADFEVIML